VASVLVDGGIGPVTLTWLVLFGWTDADAEGILRA